MGSGPLIILPEVVISFRPAAVEVQGGRLYLLFSPLTKLVLLGAILAGVACEDKTCACCWVAGPNLARGCPRRVDSDGSLCRGFFLGFACVSDICATAFRPATLRQFLVLSFYRSD